MMGGVEEKEEEGYFKLVLFEMGLEDLRIWVCWDLDVGEG